MIPIFFYISLSTYICYQILKYRKGLIILENKKYNSKDFWKYIKENSKEIFITPELLSIILIIISINTNDKIAGISAIIIYMILSLMLIKKSEGKLKQNKNTILIELTVIIFYVIALVLCNINYHNIHSEFLIFENTWIYYTVMVLMSYLTYIILLISAFISTPLRRIKRKSKKIKTT